MFQILIVSLGERNVLVLVHSDCFLLLEYKYAGLVLLLVCYEHVFILGLQYLQWLPKHKVSLNFIAEKHGIYVEH